MKDVTGQMQRFKEASRHIWNSYLMPGEGVLDMAVEASFLQIERELLRSIVTNPSDPATRTRRWFREAIWMLGFDACRLLTSSLVALRRSVRPRGE